MAAISEADLGKALGTLENAAKAAEDGDKAEETRALDVLKHLKRQVVTAELLRSTAAGKRVNKLCKHASAAISTAAKAAVDAWKDCVKQQDSQQGDAPQPSAKKTPGPGSQDLPAPRGGSHGERGSGASGSGAMPERSKTGSGSQLLAPSGGSSGSLGLTRTPSIGGGSGSAGEWKAKAIRSGNETRDKVRVMFAESLALSYARTEAQQLQDPNTLAAAIEEAMYDLFHDVNNDYKAKARSLNFNLKDAKNPDLRERVLGGQVAPEQLVRLTAEEMASDEQKKKNKELKDWLAKEAVRGNTNTATTDMFQCGRCKQRKTTYYQLQTRSADEPMTTFVTCANCGQRWKFC